MKSQVTPNTSEMPLAGIRVLDLTQAYLGPYATFLMAKAGAEVIKVEPPGGEITRLRSAVNPGATLPFALLNTNKRSMTLNLKSEQGKALFLQLAQEADVVIENFAPGVMDKLGVGWEVLHALNPRLVYASGTGFGLSGEGRDRQAMDVCIQAFSGVMSITGTPDGPPMKAGPAFADFLSGIHLYAATVTALLRRARTGQGGLAEVAMQETMVPALASSLGVLHETGAPPPATGNRHNGLALAPYSVYPARDGWVAIAVVTDGHWQSLARAISRPELALDERFSRTAERCKRMDEVDALVQAWTSSMGKYEIAERLANARVPVAPVRNLKEVMEDPQMLERGMLERIEDPLLGTITVPSTPLRVHGAPLPATVRRPDVGEHTEQVLQEVLGLDAAAVADMRALGVF